MKLFSLSLLLGALLCTCSALAGQLHSYIYQQQSHSGSRDRQYQVYVPSQLSTPAPLVMALHGCAQTQQQVIANYGLKEAAERHGFILVAPFITSYDGMRSSNCWGFWFDQHTKRGMGEPEDLYQIALEVEANYSIDPNKRFITGLSSGGAMTAVMAVLYNDYFAAAAPASGLVYGETSSSVSLAGCYGSPTLKTPRTSANDIERALATDYPIPTMVLQSNNDCVVQQPAGDNIREAHLRVFSGQFASQQVCSDYFQNNYNCKHRRYTADGSAGSRSVVETVFFDGASTDNGHFWAAGEHGQTAQYNVRVGPDYPELIADFFNRHPRTGGSTPIAKPQISLVGDNPLRIALGNVFVDPGATAEDPVEGALVVDANCAVDTLQTGTYYCTYVASNSEGQSAAVSRTIEVFDPQAPPLHCDTVTATPQQHINQNRATRGGDWDLYAITTGDNAAIGFYFQSWSSVTLHQGETDQWYSQQPEACRQAAEPDPAPAPVQCTEYYASNYQHQQSGRAASCNSWYSCAVGSGQNMGLTNTYTFTTLRLIDTNYYEIGSCP